MQISLAKKIFAVGAAGSLLAGLLPFAASAAVHAAGTNVLSNGTVYFINLNGQKQPYTSAGAFLSYGINSWGNVSAASAEDLALPTGPFVPPMDGSLINDNGTVYLITAGQRAGFTSAANFLGLGYAWSNVIPGDTSFMTAKAPISSTAMAHPAGTLVNDNGTVYLMSTTGKQGIPSLSVFNSWGYSFSKVVPANSYDSAVAMSNGIMPAWSAGCLSPLACNSSTGTGTGTSNGSVNVSLASNNPAASYVATGSAFNTFALVNFSAGSNPATVTSVTVTRTGLGADSDIANVYLFNGNTNLALGQSLGSGRATFTNSNGLFTVPANSTVTIAIKADMNTQSATNFVSKTYAFGINSASDITVSGGGTVTGSFPIMGNAMNSTILSNPSLATLQVQSTAVGSSVNAGTKGALVASFQFLAGNSNVNLKQVKLTEVGSINAQSDLANLKLMNGSNTQVGSTVTQLNPDGTAVFDMSNAPYTLAAGQTVTFNVYADVNGTPARNFYMSIQRAADIQAVDTTYNTGILASNWGATTFTSAVTGTTVNVQAGTLVVTTDASSPSGTVATGVTNQTIAKFDLNASGEPIKVSTLPVQFVYTGTCTTDTAAGCDNVNFANLKLVDDQGVQLGSTYVTPSAGETASGTSHVTGANGGFSVTFGASSPLNYIVAANTTRVISVKADVLSTFDTALSQFQSNLTAGTNNAQGTISFSNISTTATPGHGLTLSTTPFSQSANGAFAASSYTKSTPGVRVASFLLTAGSGEGINLSSVTVQTGAAAAGNYVNLRVNVNGTSFGSTQGTVANTTNYVFSGNTVTIPAGASAVVDVYADVQSGATAGTAAAVSLVSATGTGATSGTSRTSTGGTVTGQSITIAGAGTLTESTDTSAVASSNVAMGATGVTMGSFKMTTGSTEGVNVTSIKVTDTTNAGKNAGNALANLKLFDGQTQIGPTVAALSGSGTTWTATFNFSPAYTIAANTVKTISIVADVNPYNSTTSTSGSTHTFGIAAATDVVATGASSGAAITPTGTPTANTMTILRTTLTVTLDATSANGTQVTSASSNVAVYDFTASSKFDAILSGINLSVTGPASPGITSANTFTLKDANGTIAGSTCTSSATGTAAASATVSCTLPAGYTISAGTTRQITVVVNTTANSWAHSGSTYNSYQVALTGITYSDQGGTTTANLPANMLPVNGNTLSY